MATLCAIAVSGSFFVGSTVPLAWPSIPFGAPTGATVADRPLGPIGPCPADASVVARRAVGYIDTVRAGRGLALTQPANVFVAAGTRMEIVGWAALENGPGSAICLIVDGHVVPGPATYGIRRPDVAAATNIIADLNAGFRVEATARPGVHTIRVGVLEADKRSVDALGSSFLATAR